MEGDHPPSGCRPLDDKALTSNDLFEECLAAGSDASDTRERSPRISPHVRSPGYTPTDRILLASLARLLSRDRWSIFLVTPATLLRWHRELVAHHWTHPHTGRGRRGLPEATVELVVRLARENPRWGYLRIVGEARKLGVAVSAASVRTILCRHGLGPAPRAPGRDPAGWSSCAPRPPGPWPATSSASRPSASRGCTC